MGKLHIEDTAGAKILIAAGKFTIQDATALKDILMEAYSSSEKLLIDLKNMESMDLACIQLLCSVNKTFRKAHKLISINGSLPQGALKSLEDIAIDPESCDAEIQGHCLWATGGENG